MATVQDLIDAVNASWDLASPTQKLDAMAAVEEAVLGSAIQQARFSELQASADADLANAIAEHADKLVELSDLTDQRDTLVDVTVPELVVHQQELIAAVAALKAPATEDQIQEQQYLDQIALEHGLPTS
jgi:hypothetical protein